MVCKEEVYVCLFCFISETGRVQRYLCYFQSYYYLFHRVSLKISYKYLNQK